MMRLIARIIWWMLPSSYIAKLALIVIRHGIDEARKLRSQRQIEMPPHVSVCSGCGQPRGRDAE